MSGRGITNFKKCARQIDNSLDLEKFFASAKRAYDNNDPETVRSITNIIEGLIESIYGCSIENCFTKDSFTLVDEQDGYKEYLLVNYITIYGFVLVWITDEDCFIRSYRLHKLDENGLPKGRAKRRKFILDLLSNEIS